MSWADTIAPQATTLNQLVADYEAPSGNNPYGPGGNQGGAYQFVPSTWRRYLSQIADVLGISPSQYPIGSSAPPAVQDAVFAQAVSANGLNDWTCPGCDPGLSAYLANNPSAANLPVAGGVGSTGALGQGSATGGAASPSGTSTGPSLTNPLGLGTSLWGGIVQRLGYGVVGLVLVVMALAIYALRTRDQS